MMKKALIAVSLLVAGSAHAAGWTWAQVIGHSPRTGYVEYKLSVPHGNPGNCPNHGYGSAANTKVVIIDDKRRQQDNAFFNYQLQRMGSGFSAAFYVTDDCYGGRPLVAWVDSY